MTVSEKLHTSATHAAGNDPACPKCAGEHTKDETLVQYIGVRREIMADLRGRVIDGNVRNMALSKSSSHHDAGKQPMIGAGWQHTPENQEYPESWCLSVGGKVEALVVQHTPKLYSAYIYPLGKRRQVGDAHGSAAGAKAACVRQLRKTGIIG